MHSLLFSLESSLLAPLLEFALSPSGHVEPRRGLALGWLGSVVAGLAVMFGTADRAQADDCYNIAVGSCGNICDRNDPCDWTHDGTPTNWQTTRYCHDQDLGCEWNSSFCFC